MTLFNLGLHKLQTMISNGRMHMNDEKIRMTREVVGAYFKLQLKYGY